MSHLLESEAIDCDFAPVGGFTPAHTLQDYGAMGFCGGGVVWVPYLGRKVAMNVLAVPEANLFDSRNFPMTCPP